MKFQATSAAAVMALVAGVNSHMIMENPVPFGKPNSNPLEADQSNFPCKATGPADYTVTKMNQWKAGESQTISFIGSAVHGGGSCQFSITTDKNPTKQSQWKVIHSVIGGCPSDAEGNLPADPAGHGANKFPVTMPKDVPDGQYTFAWTWFNKIGNREMYMNCAPITVSGGASGNDVAKSLGTLPDMVVANLPNTSCGTIEMNDYAYPNPGKSVVTGSKAKPVASLSGAGCASMTKLGAGAGKLGAPAGATGGASSAAGGASSAAATSAPAKPTSNTGGVFAPGASTAVESPSSAPSSAPAAASSAAATSETPSQPTTAPAEGGAGKVACSNNGGVVCIGSTQFGICDRGFAVPQALAAGTKCTNGAITKRTSHRAHRRRAHRARANL